MDLPTNLVRSVDCKQGSVPVRAIGFNGKRDGQMHTYQLYEHSMDAEVVSGSEVSHVYLWSLVNQNVVANLSHMRSRVIHSWSGSAFVFSQPPKVNSICGSRNNWQNQEEEQEDSE
ncbi:hypothetical protein CHUAL_012068 [Chamberlinius hualienensis]